MSDAFAFFAALDRPSPEITRDNAPFFEGCARGELLVQECKACGRRQHYPRFACTRCGGDVAWIRASGKGVVHTFTIVRYTRDRPFNELAPFVVAMIDLPEGVRMLSNIITDTPELVRIGADVEVLFAEVSPGSQIHAPYFRLCVESLNG